MKLSNLQRWTLAGIVTLSFLGALVACGGTGIASLGGVGTGGTGISMGTVTGFGSVIVDGISYNSATPQYLAESAIEEAATAPSTAVELGDQVTLSLDALGQPSVLRISPALLGPVGTIDAQSASFTVNGVTVHTNLNSSVLPVTNYAGLSNIAALASGMQVEVHGVWGNGSAVGAGFVQATLVELAAATNVAARVTGVVSNLSADSFTLGPLSVHVTAASTVLPVGATLANGALVNVWSAAPVSSGAMSASVIRVSSILDLKGNLQLAGLISDLGVNGFTLSGIPVDTRALSTQSGLTNSTYVVVSGTVNASGTMVLASAVRAYSPEVILNGTVTAFSNIANFKVRGVPVDASLASFQGNGAALIGNGAYVAVSGIMTGGNILAAKMVNVSGPPPDGSTVDLTGTVSNSNVSNGTFTLTWSQDGQIQNSNVIIAPNAVFGNSSAAAILNGASVEIEASNTNNGLVAYTINSVNASSMNGNSGRD